jgi:hypothetical protein
VEFGTHLGECNKAAQLPPFVEFLFLFCFGMVDEEHGA